MKKSALWGLSIAGAAGLLATVATAQQPPATGAATTPPAAPAPAASTPAPPTEPVPQAPATPPSGPQVNAPASEEPAGQSTLPPIDIVQPKPKQPQPVQQTRPAAPKSQPKAKAAVAPPPPPPPSEVASEPVDPGPTEVLANPIYGSPAATGAARRAFQAATSPINPASITPQNLEGFSSAATNVSAEKLAEQQPRNINEVFTKVPGLIVINDDGSGHHGGLAARGSPARRSRKMLVMEDGHPINLALWLDPSVHFFAPADRIEGVEVLRGTIITHGPNNNFGVVNVRNLSPFGPNETVISSAIGFTQNKAGDFVETDDDEAGVRVGKSQWDTSAKWHGHTRQTAGNVGLVFSYSGENVQGTWDTERLRFHDFYGAIGWKGSDSDLTLSLTHTRQRDSYDELNLTGQEEEEGGTPGAVERAFYRLKHCKTCYAPFSGLDTYYGEVWRGQMVHNLYIDKDTTLTSRLYMGQHRRDRYQNISAEVEFPADDSRLPIVDPATGEVIFAEDTMFGRLRTFRHIGAEARAEFANRPFIAGMTQTIQTGLRYEYQDMTNRNFLGAEGEILKDGDKTGTTIFDRSLNANAVSGFLQTSIKTNPNFTVTPGVRFEWYDVKRRNRVVAGEESEAEEQEPVCDNPVVFPEGCLVIGDIDFDPARKRESTSSFHALPGISFAYTGLKRTTVFGGYNRGMSTAVMRNEDFPTPDEIGDNFELGIRSTAIRGLGIEFVGFHQRLSDFQFGSSFTSGADRTFGRADKVEINGLELAGRINSQPYTGGSYNVFAEGNYTYARAIIKKGLNPDTGEDFSGNHLPEVPFHVAALTLGIQQTTGWKWDASMTWTYRGSFFTDENNTPFGRDLEGENGEVPSVWLLSARANLHIPNTGASLFISGDNLLDKFYLSDREDGLKPGMGRTIWTGFKYKF